MGTSAVATRKRGAPRGRLGVPAHRALGWSDADALEVYYALLVTRRLSEQTLRLAFQGAIDVAIPSDGHEAAQIASIRALRPEDTVYLYYRSVPAAYARGLAAREILLDFFGRAEGPSSGGKNLPGHWARRDLRLMSISGSVGTQIPHAVGSALASRLRGDGSVSIAYFGDGGSSKADFHEGLNFAAIHRLPAIFFCENNGIAISVPFTRQAAVGSVVDRAVGYGMPGVGVDGADPLAVYRVTAEAVERARRGDGPTLIEARVTRIGQHTSQVGDLRQPEEVARARERDPIPLFGTYLRRCGLLDGEQDAVFARRAEAEVADAVRSAEVAPGPSRAAAFRDVLAGSQARSLPAGSCPARPALAEEAPWHS